MKVEIWSDVVCPWCYIGKRRLETALADFPHRDDVEVVWRSFQLDPTTERVEGESGRSRLARKIGVSAAEVTVMQERVDDLATAEGLRFDQSRALPTNTFDLHRVIHLAGGRGVQDAVKEAFMSAYFEQGEDLHDVETVVAIASRAGLDPTEVREVLADPNAYADAVESDRREAAALGANGVPFFVIDRRYGVSGAQPVEVFRDVLDRAWSDTHPVALVDPTNGTDPDGTCVDDTCVV